jgi:hypothetical protein
LYIGIPFGHFYEDSPIGHFNTNLCIESKRSRKTKTGLLRQWQKEAGRFNGCFHGGFVCRGFEGE